MSVFEQLYKSPDLNRMNLCQFTVSMNEYENISKSTKESVKKNLKRFIFNLQVFF